MSAPAHAERVVGFEEACGIVQERATALDRRTFATEEIPLQESAGRVLAKAICADRDLPPFARAMRDGFAVRSEDVAVASEQNPSVLRIVGEIAAGAAELPAIREGEAAAIMTGAPAPAGADAVIMAEQTRAVGKDRVQILRAVKPDDNIAARGSEAQAGTVLLSLGAALDAAAIAVAASAGAAQLKVFRRPRVAVIATGSELVEINAQPAPHQIRNSNSYALAAQAQAAGADPVMLRVAPDERQRLEEIIGEGLSHDLLILSGGVSVGKYDLVEQVLGSFGAEFFFTGALIQPGKPVVFGQADTCGKKKPFFGLPGNPVSAMVTFQLFVAPFLRALAGRDFASLQFVLARLKAPVRTKPGLTRFLPAVLKGNPAEVELARWQGSGDVAGLAHSNCYLVVPPDRPVIEGGELVSVLLRGWC